MPFGAGQSGCDILTWITPGTHLFARWIFAVYLLHEYGKSNILSLGPFFPSPSTPFLFLGICCSRAFNLVPTAVVSEPVGAAAGQNSSSWKHRWRDLSLYHKRIGETSRLLLSKIFLVVFHYTEAVMNLMYGNVCTNAVRLLLPFLPILLKGREMWGTISPWQRIWGKSCNSSSK